jgi:hypothetical protein
MLVCFRFLPTLCQKRAKLDIRQQQLPTCHTMQIRTTKILRDLHIISDVFSNFAAIVSTIKNPVIMKSFLFVLGMFIAIQAHAAIGDTFEATTTEGTTLTYKITGENEVQVGDGHNVAVGSYTADTLTIPDAVVNDGVSYKVTSIGGTAFRLRTFLTKVILGNNVTSIGAGPSTGAAN